MKKIKVLPLVIAALSLGFASCSSERAIDLQEGGVELSLTTSIQDQSRVVTLDDGTTNHWSAGDKIGVFSSTLSAENVEYTSANTEAQAATNFTATTPVLIPFGQDEHTVQAYYPFTAGDASKININLATKNDQPVLWASGTVTNAAPVVKLEFQHRLAKLRIVVHPEEGGAALGDNTTVTAVGALSEASFDVVNNGTLNPGVDVADLTLHAVKGTDDKIVEYYTYIMPTQKLTDLEIKISHDDKAYSAKLTSRTDVAAGKYYKYTIQLTNGAAELLPGDGTDTSDAVIAGTTEGEDDTNVIPAAPEADTTTPDEPATPADPVNATVTGDNFAGDVLTVPATGGTASITVNVPDPVAADATISAKVDETWVTAADGATLTRAIADKTITFTLEENTGAERTAQVTLSAEGMNDFKFTIKQEAKVVAEPVTATLSETALNAEAAAQTFDLTLTGFEGEVTADGAPAWVTITGLNTTGTPKNLKVTVAENTATTDRNATITLKAEGMNPVSFTVTQKGAVEETPAGMQPLFEAGELTNYFDTTKIASGASAEVSTGTGYSGTDAVHLYGTTGGSNGVGFFVLAKGDSAPKKVSFRIKGTSEKSLQVRGKLTDVFINLGTIATEEVTFSKKDGRGSYTGSIDTQGEWVLVTFDVADFPYGVSRETLLEFRVTKSANYDLYFSDFKVEY